MKQMQDNQEGQKELKKVALHYFETLVDVARESFLILDANLRVLLANQTFYQNFQVQSVLTENILLYDLGNGQWNIPQLKSLLENILPDKKAVKDYRVSHTFETIGVKTMLLNARQIDNAQLIVLAIEDVTDQENLKKKLAEYTRTLEVKVAQRTNDLATKVKDLEQMNKIMVGREMKMIELKAELEKFKKSSSP